MCTEGMHVLYKIDYTFTHVAQHHSPDHPEPPSRSSSRSKMWMSSVDVLLDAPLLAASGLSPPAAPLPPALLEAEVLSPSVVADRCQRVPTKNDTNPTTPHSTAERTKLFAQTFSNSDAATAARASSPRISATAEIFDADHVVGCWSSSKLSTFGALCRRR